MKTQKIIAVFAAALIGAAAHAQTDSIEVDTTYTLGEVTVNGMRVINKVDRQVLLPTSTMKKHSSNGYDLLNKMTLNGIITNPERQEIRSLRGGGVQVRINDIKANQQDITALRPDEVVRVEYIDNPGVRYSDGSIDAVINFVVKRRYAGYVGGLGTMQAFTTGFNNSNAYFKYNYKKSEFCIYYNFSYRGYDERKVDSENTYFFPDGTQRQRQYLGYNTDFMYTTNTVQLGYNLAEPDKYTLNVSLYYNQNNTPKYGYNQLAKETSMPDLYIYNKKSKKMYIPSLDIYWSLNLPKKQNITANVVGTYIGTDYNNLSRNYLFSQSPEQSMQADPVNDYSYSTTGRKYSLISEAIYTKNFNREVFSAGGEYTVSHTDNAYKGAVNTDAVLNSNNLYLFAQLQGKLGVFNYQVGLGANYLAIHQGDIGFNKWTLRPQLSLSTKITDNLFVRYSGRMSQLSPSLSQLSDVRNQSDELNASDGNTGLKPYTGYSNSLTVSWTRPLFNFQLYGSWYYAPDIIMTSYIPELQDDGTYLLISKPENQKSFSRKSLAAYFTLHAIRDILDISLYGDYSNYSSRGLAYSHNYDAWRWGGSANLMLGRWNVSASFYTAPKSYFAESMGKGENQSNLSVSYKYKDLKVGLGVLLLGYPQGYDYVGKTDSKYLQSTSHTYIKDNGNMVYFTLSYNFSHGRKYQTERKKLHNSDNDNGIR
jgi:hypothetical protein